MKHCIWCITSLFKISLHTFELETCCFLRSVVLFLCGLLDQSTCLSQMANHERKRFSNEHAGKERTSIMGTVSAPRLNQFTLQDPCCPALYRAKSVQSKRAWILFAVTWINKIRESSVLLKEKGAILYIPTIENYRCVQCNQAKTGILNGN